MDINLDQLILIVAAVGGLGAVFQHFWDRYAPSGLYKAAPQRAAAALQEVLHVELQAAADALQKGVEALPVQMEASLSNAMDRQRALAQADMEAAMKAQVAEAEKLGKSAEMSIVRGIGVDKQAAARVSSLLGEAILGPALPLLRQFAPGLADALEENPQLIDVVVRNPLFIKYVQPRIEQYLGSMGTGTPPAQEGGWGT